MEPHWLTARTVVLQYLSHHSRTYVWTARYLTTIVYASMDLLYYRSTSDDANLPYIPSLSLYMPPAVRRWQTNGYFFLLRRWYTGTSRVCPASPVPRLPSLRPCPYYWTITVPGSIWTPRKPAGSWTTSRVSPILCMEPPFCQIEPISWGHETTSLHRVSSL